MTTTTTEDDASTVVSKDITNLIQITNEEEDEETEEEPTIECLAFCPPQGTKLVDEMVKTVDDASLSIRGAVDEHVVPKIQTAVDEHWKPKVEHVRRQSMETLEGVQRTSMATIESSQKALESFQKDSQKLLENVQKSSGDAIEGVKIQSQKLVEQSSRSMGEFQDSLKPHCDKIVETTVQAHEAATKGKVGSYYLGRASGFSTIIEDCTYWMLLEGTLRGFGRVVFCDNPITGVFLWLGILVGSPIAGISALLAALMANGTAFYFEVDNGELKSGKFAMNAILVGCSLVESFSIKLGLFLAVALAPFVLLIEYYWTKNLSLPALLMPSNIVILSSLLLAKVWSMATGTPLLFEETSYSVVGDLLVVLGVLLCSRILAFSLIGGAFLSMQVLGWILGFSSPMGGLNAALLAAGLFYYFVPSPKLIILAIFGVVVSSMVQSSVDMVLETLGISATTTLGYSLTLLGLFGGMDAFGTTSVLQKVEELSTPEDYLTTDTEEDESDEEAPPPISESTPLLDA